MNILSLISAVISLASRLTEFASNRRLIVLGEARAAHRALAEAWDCLERAQAARRNVKHDPDSIVRDPRNRD